MIRNQEVADLVAKGEIASAGSQAFAQADGSALYILRMLRLAFLSPQIVRAIIEGRQPQWLNAQALANRITIPVSWAEQYMALSLQTQA